METRSKIGGIKVKLPRPMTSKVPSKVKKEVGKPIKPKKSTIKKQPEDTRLAKYGYFLNKDEIIKKISETEEIKELTLFEENSIICKGVKAHLSPNLFLADAFTRYKETKEDIMHLYDVQLYSKIIYNTIKDEGRYLKLIGPLKECVTGKIMSYLDFDFVMLTLRYLNKSFIIFTEEKDSYCFQMNRNAIMKSDLAKIYSGNCKTPPLRHPYYNNCTKLRLIYCTSDENIDAYEYETSFLLDLFSNIQLFPELTELKIFVSHSQW